MTDNKTYGYIKKRILDALDEASGTNEVFVSDGNRQILVSRMPDAVNSSLVRMYESLPVSRKSARLCVNFFDNMAEKKNGEYSFRAKGDNSTFTVGVFGEGAIYVSCDGNVTELSCDGTASLSFKSFPVDTKAGETYTVTAGAGVNIVSFAAYDNCDNAKSSRFPPEGYCSVSLPTDFSSFIAVYGRECEKEYLVSADGCFAYFPVKDVASGGVMDVVYEKKPPVITADTDDDFEFELSMLEAEALINLAASELCREGEASLYSRLFYKYNDLSEGLREPVVGGRRVNGFYKSSSKRRWHNGVYSE